MDHDGHCSGIFHLSFFHKFSFRPVKCTLYSLYTICTMRTQIPHWNSKKKIYKQKVMPVATERPVNMCLCMCVCDFIHNKSGSIFIYVEMDLQHKQMQNLCYTNESVVCSDCFALTENIYVYMENQWNLLWLMRKQNEWGRKKKKEKLCIFVWNKKKFGTKHTWKSEHVLFLFCSEFGFQQTSSLFPFRCLTVIQLHSLSHL